MKTRDQILISPEAHKILNQIIEENPYFAKVLESSSSLAQFQTGLKNWVEKHLKNKSQINTIFDNNSFNRKEFEQTQWRDYAAIRLLDYIENEGRTFQDLNLKGKTIENSPLKKLYLAAKKGRGGATTHFFEDFLYLFRQLQGDYKPDQIDKHRLDNCMEKYQPAYNEQITEMLRNNRDRIINILIEKIDSGVIENRLFSFESDMNHEDKYNQMLKWWNDYRFHLAFAVRSPDLLNELLDHTLSSSIMDRLYRAEEKGMPFFVNPYYLSLVAVDDNQIPSGIDQTIRDYMIYSDELIDEFGEIVAWEKEDQVEPGKPNAAGWILPTRHSMHRRYPNVAILIPDTMGRACGGLCSTCQRMYDFQRGHLDFDYDKKKPQESWPDKLNRLMNYFKEDSQLRDILITGGDALMSSNQSLQQILDAVYKMARKKKEENKERPQGKKYAEMVRVRLGTRLPVYLPQRIDDEMIEILQDFKEKARKVGIKQFIIQTHIESPLEITDRTREAVQKFLKAGWIVTNQLVFTAAASRRGHTAQLRKILNDIGVLTYYTFSCKGFMENHHHFVPHARAVQEQLEEKIYGVVSKDSQEQLNDFTENVPDLKKKIDELREEADVDFLSTDRNMLNLPAVGKSLTFRTIGLTWDGRRILEFDHDPNRAHSPIIEKMGKVVIIESKSISDYLKQLQEMGEDVEDYKGVYGYSMGATEQRAPIYRYPEYDFETTDRISNLEV